MLRLRISLDIVVKMSRRRFDSGERYRIDENLKLRKKKEFLGGISGLNTRSLVPLRKPVTTSRDLDSLP
jgi:hypothetical protein